MDPPAKKQQQMQLYSPQRIKPLLFQNINRNKIVDQQVVRHQPNISNRKVTWAKEIDQNNNSAMDTGPTSKMRRRTTYEIVDMDISMSEDDTHSASTAAAASTNKTSSVQEVRRPTSVANGNVNDEETRHQDDSKPSKRGGNLWWLACLACNLFDEPDLKWTSSAQWRLCQVFCDWNVVLSGKISLKSFYKYKYSLFVHKS